MRWIVAPLIIAAGLVLVAVGLVIGCSLYIRHRCRAVGMGKPDWLFRDDGPGSEPIKGYLWLLDRDMETHMREQRRKGVTE